MHLQRRRAHGRGSTAGRRPPSRRTWPGTSWWTARRRRHARRRRAPRAAAANVGNTTTINVTGPAGVSSTNESVDDRRRATRWPTGDGQLGHDQLDRQPGRQRDHAAGDTFTVDNSGEHRRAGVKTDWGVNGVDLNGDGDLDVGARGCRELDRRRRDRHDRYPADSGTRSTPAAAPSPVRPSRPAITIDGAAAPAVTTRSRVAPAATRSPAALATTTVAGGLGNDSLDGGAGEDAVDYSASATAVVVTARCDPASDPARASTP